LSVHSLIVVLVAILCGQDVQLAEFGVAGVNPRYSGDETLGHETAA
jgi:hypothetical protein